MQFVSFPQYIHGLNLTLVSKCTTHFLRAHCLRGICHTSKTTRQTTAVHGPGIYIISTNANYWRTISYASIFGVNDNVMYGYFSAHRRLFAEKSI